MASKKQYFRTLEEFNNPSLTEQLAAKEFADEIPVEELLQDASALDSTKSNRRDFLKILGFSTAAVTLASCEAPIIKSIPYAVKPESVTPGIPTYYASTMWDGYDYVQVLIKTREGRPIKIERHKDAPYFGGMSARVQASILDLYDNDRVKFPMIDGAKTDWNTLDSTVSKKIAGAGGKVVLLTRSLPSPTSKKLISEFIGKYPKVEHVVFDPVGESAALDAAQEVFGKRVLPHYDLKKAELVVAFNADFLNDWNTGGMSSDYAAARKPGPNMLRHIQVESILSMTGANADDRFPRKPSAVHKLLKEVYDVLKGGSGSAEAKDIAKELQAKGAKAVVFADGSKDCYLLAYAINQLIGSQVMSGKEIYLREYDEQKFTQFLAEAKAGGVSVLLNVETNPLYAYANSKAVSEALKKIPFKVALSAKKDESNADFNAFAPVPNWLECWNDFNPMSGVYALQQPTIKNIFDTRQFQDSLLSWMGATTNTVVEAAPASAPVDSTATASNGAQAAVSKRKTFYDYLRSNWEGSILSQVGGIKFSQALYNGVNVGGEAGGLSIGAVSLASLNPIKTGDFELQLYTKASMGDGTQANNPWLQEMPDPITRTSWDNYATMHVEDAEALGIDTKFGGNDYNGRMQFNGAFISVSANGYNLEVPVFVQPGQAKGAIGIALGYGRTQGGKVANQIGVNAFPFFANGQSSVGAVKITKLDKDLHPFANMQVQNTLLGRYEIARDVNLQDFLSLDSHEWNEPAVMGTHRGAETPVNKVDLWTPFDRADGPHFNLSIDLNSCTGCGACVIACQAENNVPVVGKDEIRMARDMYWLRIDRYYSNTPLDMESINNDPDTPTIDKEIDLNGDNKLTQKEALHDGLKEPQMYKILRKAAADNPDVIFQPVMCQHCNHAPCETVCPVAATSHGKQGQNQMAYNRCVGTRYCANNCPYKVRRFNWFNYAQNDKFDYHMNNDLGRMVLNPDVAVRVRGVMEKCSMCIQLTQRTISQAKAENRTVRKDEFYTACSNACDTGSIQFGDINNPESEVVALSQDKRKYVLLEEIGTKPNVMYHVKVRNTKRLSLRKK